MRIVLAATLALAAVPALAQGPSMKPGAADPSRVTAGAYKVDPGHTQVLFTVDHLGFTQYTGQFTQPTGTLTLDRAHPANDRVEVVFPINKVSTTVAALDAHLQKPEFFDAAKYPEGRFVSTKVAVSGMTATITGNLTLKSVTRPVVLQARFYGAGANPMNKATTIGFRATTSIKRSDFGIDYGLPLVSDKVDLVINASFEKQ